ncbi:MAG: L-threonylcarbamoyladenylate synthase [Candidatus Asgardarchaeia archaeon]
MGPVDVIKRGGVIIMPTDTVYGLAGDARKCDVYKRIISIKGKPKGPLVVLMSSLDEVERYARLVCDIIPGITYILPYKGGLCDAVAFKGRIAVRIPRDEKIRAFVQKTGPLISTSANPHGKPTPRLPSDLPSFFIDRVDFVWEEGPLEPEPSTIYDPLEGRILRKGKWYDLL